jgi:methyl-accepting chemotaxis protein
MGKYSLRKPCLYLSAFSKEFSTTVTAINVWGEKQMGISNLKVRSKLAVLVGVGCIGMFLVGVIGLTGMNKAGLLIFCLGILVCVGFSVTVSITKSLKGILGILNRIADGDLSTQLKIYADDEIGDLGKSINRMQTSISAMITSINETASQVASSANILNVVSEQSATNSEMMTAQTSTVATACEEMVSTSGGIAQSCNMAAESSRQGSDLATEGAYVVQETVTGMNRIAERVKETAATLEKLGARSDQIGEIVGTIEDIAD